MTNAFRLAGNSFRDSPGTTPPQFAREPFPPTPLR